MSFKVQRKLFAPVLSCESFPSLTRQEFQHDADMNVIVNKFLRTGVLEQPNLGRPVVDGFESPGDFSEACELAFEQRHLDIVSQNESGSDDVSEPSEQQLSEPGSEDSHSPGVSDLESGQKS